MYCSISL